MMEPATKKAKNGLTEKLQGAMTAIVTPFDENGQVAWQVLRDLVKFQIDEGK